MDRTTPIVSVLATAVAAALVASLLVAAGI